MEKINLLYETGEILSIYVVRYFRFKNNAYLIYTLQEKDDRDYVKLYVVKVMNELNQKVCQTVRRNDEWKQMKGIVKAILTQIKKGHLTCIEDLEPLELEKMIIYESKSFSIASDLVELLSTKRENLSSTLSTNENVKDNENEEIETLEIETLEIDPEIEEIEILELEPDEDSIQENISEEIEVLEL